LELKSMHATAEDTGTLQLSGELTLMFAIIINSATLSTVQSCWRLKLRWRQSELGYLFLFGEYSRRCQQRERGVIITVLGRERKKEPTSSPSLAVATSSHRASDRRLLILLLRLLSPRRSARLAKHAHKVAVNLEHLRAGAEDAAAEANVYAPDETVALAVAAAALRRVAYDQAAGARMRASAWKAGDGALGEALYGRLPALARKLAVPKCAVLVPAASLSASSSSAEKSSGRRTH